MISYYPPPFFFVLCPQMWPQTEPSDLLLGGRLNEIESHNRAHQSLCIRTGRAHSFRLLRLEQYDRRFLHKRTGAESR